MKRNIIKSLALSLALTIGIGTVSASADSVEVKPTPNKTGDILVLGGSLNETEKNALLQWFQAPQDTKTIYTSNEMIIEQLGLDPNDPVNYQGGCFSSAYVKITEPSLGKGDSKSGLNITVDNLTEVTDIMLMNALITSGIYNANVKVSAPFPVTGTSALAGILAGAEDVRGEEISLNQKETAQKEIETTITIGNEIGSEEASSIINEIKTEVIKENPNNDKDIINIVNNVINNYNINISDASKDQIVSLMSDVNDLNLDYSSVKDTLEEATNTIKDKLTALNKQLEEAGFWDKIANFFRNLWNKITGFFERLFNSEEPSVDETVEPVEEQSPVIEERPTEEQEVVQPSEEQEVIQPSEEQQVVEPSTEEPVIEEAQPTPESNVIMPDDEQSVETSSEQKVIVYDYDNTPDREYMGLKAPAVPNSKLAFN